MLGPVGAPTGGLVRPHRPPRKGSPGSQGSPAGRAGGFSAVEVLVTASILAVALLGIASLFPTAAANVHSNGGMARATVLAQQRIEQLKNVSFATLAAMPTANTPSALPASEQQTLTEGNHTFTRQTWVAVSGTAPRREAVITVILQWAETTGGRTLRLDTAITE